MANYSCSACEDIRETDPSLIVNGLGDTECASLQNDTGLSPSSGNNDFTDLTNLNDCLVGNQATEVEAFDVCDWKTFMKQFIPNVWTTLKGIICAIGGIWTNIHKLECLVNFMFDGVTFSFGEYTDTGTSYLVAGKGVSFLNVSASGTAGDVIFRYIAGGLGEIAGSCMFYTADFQDKEPVYNYDNGGVNPVRSASRKGNSDWNATDTKPTAASQLVYEIRVKNSEYPQIETIFEGFGLESVRGAFHTQIHRFFGGNYAFGQSGGCDRITGEPNNAASDRGHLVPSGWTYIQLRISYIDVMDASATGTQFSPHGFCGVRMNQGKIEC